MVSLKAKVKKIFCLCMLIIMFANNIMGQRANALWFFMNEVEDATKENKVYLTCDMSGYEESRSISFKIENKSESIIYIDLANSFFMLNEDFESLFVPSSTSISDGKSSGVGVNLGSIGQAIGIGGTMGNILNGVSVGSNNSSSQSTTVYAQRIIAIPPQVSKEIISKSYAALDEEMYAPTEIMNNLKLNVRDIRNYSFENSPYKLCGYVTCSYSENFDTKFSVRKDVYVEKIIGTKWRNLTSVRKALKGTTKEAKIVTEVYPNWREWGEGLWQFIWFKSDIE